ncbi:unnamed protein product [Amoebophrya sp. A120]|nr:unnamed protein product [Amoebophrya sp. A120]|eukprot:GSA120T00014300001.1
MGKKSKKAKEKVEEAAKYDHPVITPSRIDNREVQATIKLVFVVVFDPPLMRTNLFLLYAEQTRSCHAIPELIWEITPICFCLFLTIISRWKNTSYQAAPVCTLLEFTIKVKPTTKISYIEDLIIHRHGGSIDKLSICVNRFHPEEIVSADASLEECGVTGGECIIYYDFVPVSGALLR